MPPAFRLLPSLHSLRGHSSLVWLSPESLRTTPSIPTTIIALAVLNMIPNILSLRNASDLPRYAHYLFQVSFTVYHRVRCFIHVLYTPDLCYDQSIRNLSLRLSARLSTISFRMTQMMQISVFAMTNPRARFLTIHSFRMMMASTVQRSKSLVISTIQSMSSGMLHCRPNCILA
jgi:hypothetical protein